MKKIIGATITILFFLSLAIPALINAQSQDNWADFLCYDPPTCPESAKCKGEWSDNPSLCKVQCWYWKCISYELDYWVKEKAGSATCDSGGGGGDDWDWDSWWDDWWWEYLCF